jgi:hypothetical protein
MAGLAVVWITKAGISLWYVGGQELGLVHSTGVCKVGAMEWEWESEKVEVFV